MAIDKLINSTQGDSIIAALNAISSKVGSPYNLENKLNPAYINYDSTHAATPETVANSGITSTDVAQIETNKNNISYITYTNPFTIYADDFVELTGAGFIIPEGTAVNLPKGEYILSFTASAARTGTFVIDSGATEVYRGSINIISGSNVYRFTISEDCDTIRFASSASITITNLMIVSSIYYDGGQTEYIGETMTNAELTAEVEINKNNILTINKYAGGKNLLPNAIEAGSYVDGKIIVAVNSDGTFTVRTTEALTTNAIIPINSRPSTIENGKQYVLSGCPTGGAIRRTAYIGKVPVRQE